MIRSPVLAFLLAAVSLGLSHSQAMDLLEAHQLARQNDPVYKGAESSIMASEAGARAAVSVVLPTVSLNANNTYGQASGSNINSHSYTNTSYGITLRQPLFRWQNWIDYRKAQIGVEILKLQLAQAAQDLVLRVAQAYFDVLNARETMDSILAQKQAVAQQLANAKRNLQIGSGVVLDVYNAQASYDQVVAQEQVAQTNIQIKEERLKSLIQKDQMPELQPLTPHFVFTKPDKPLEEWLRAAREGNLDILAKSLEQRLADEDLAQIKSGHYPTVDLNGSYTITDGGSAVTATSSNSNVFALTLSLALPIYSGGAVVNGVDQKAALLVQANYNLSNSQRNAEINTRQAYLQALGAEQQLNSLEAALRSAQEVVTATNAGYKVGIRTSLDVLNAERQLAAARQTLIQARYDSLLSLFKLEAGRGQLTENSVREMNSLFKKN